MSRGAASIESLAIPARAAERASRHASDFNMQSSQENGQPTELS
jgi:hypothetical protein